MLIIVSVGGEKIKDYSNCLQLREIMGFGCLFISFLESVKDKDPSQSLILIFVMVNMCLLLYLIFDIR